MAYVGAKINFPFLFLTHQEKRSRTNRTVGVPCLLYAPRIFKKLYTQRRNYVKTCKHINMCFIWNSETVKTKPASLPFGGCCF